MTKKLKNNIRKGLTLFLLLGILFYSCKKEETVNVLKTYFPKDKQIVFSEYIIKNGDTIMDGKYTVCKYNGKKIKSGRYKNGKSIGPLIFYYDNGKIESIDNRYNNKFREVIFNYRNGEVERYELYDDYGNLNFIINFNEQGNVENYKGYPVMEIYQYKIANKEQFKTNINQYLKVGDILKYQYLVANIPNAKRNFNIELVGSDNATIKRTITKKPPVRIDAEEILTKKGINKIKAVVEYKFNDNKKTVIKDSIFFEVKVN